MNVFTAKIKYIFFKNCENALNFFFNNLYFKSFITYLNSSETKISKVISNIFYALNSVMKLLPPSNSRCNYYRIQEIVIYFDKTALKLKKFIFD